MKWIFYQFKTDHHVNFGNIGSYGYKIEEKSKQKVPILFYNNAYLKEINLINVSHSFILKPLVKINIAIIASNCPREIDKSTVEYLVNGLLEQIDSILRS